MKSQTINPRIGSTKITKLTSKRHQIIKLSN